MNAEQVANVMAALEEVYTHWKPTEKTVALWAFLLGDQDAGAISNAATRWMRDANAFPPAPGQLIALARPAESRTTGAEAWETLIAEIRRTGYMGTPSFADEKIARGVRFLGGWVTICSQETRDVPSNRARFIEYYESLAGRERGTDERREVQQLVRSADPELLDMLGIGRDVFGELGGGDS